MNEGIYKGEGVCLSPAKVDNGLKMIFRLSSNVWYYK
jgi:hypothetical protein